MRRVTSRGAVRAAAAGGCALALALAVSACGERAEPTGPTVTGVYPVTVQAADERPIVVERRPRSVLPVAMNAAAIVDALGLRSLVPGAPVAGPLRPSPLRRIAASRADLIVGSQVNDANALRQAAVQAGATVVVVGDSSIRDLQHSILELGLALGVPVRARAVVRAIDEQLAAVKRRLEGAAPVKVFVDTGYLIPVPDDSFAGEVLREAGAENVAGSADSTPYRINDLLAADPDFYLATDEGGTTLRDLRATRRLRGLRAVREGRFAVIPAGLLAATPGVGAAVARLAAIIRPEPGTTAAAGTTDSTGGP